MFCEALMSPCEGAHTFVGQKAAGRYEQRAEAARAGGLSAGLATSGAGRRYPCKW